MQWLKDNWQFLVVALGLVVLAGMVFSPMMTLTKDKCILIQLEDKATVELSSGIKMQGPASYRSYVKDCGVPKE